MHSESFHVQEELARCPVGRFHWQLGITIGALTLFDGYDVFNPAYVIHYVMQPWHLRPAQAGLLVSSGLVGFLLGSAAHGPVADKVGRRVTLLSGLWIASIFTLATALFANSFASFCTLRLLTGLGLGVLLPLATTYINEFAPQRSANAYAVWAVAFGWALGGSLAGVAGVLLTPRYGWQSLYWLGGCLSVLLIPIVHFTLPESVRYLAMKARVPQIVEIMTRLSPENANRYREATLVAEPATAATALLSPSYRRTTLCIWAAAFFCLFCIFGLSGWLPTIMLQRGLSFAASFGFGALLQIATFVGGLVCGYLSDWHGTRRIMIGLWWILGAASVLALSLSHGRAATFACVWAAGFFFGAQFVLNNFTAAAYETRIRATAVGMELSVGRVGAILGPWVAGYLQEASPGPTAMFTAIEIAGLIAALAIVLAREPVGGQSRQSSETDAAERRRSLT
jgi:AAHS family 4-hydroxybenzoate transporter-like MFS transporter